MKKIIIILAISLFCSKALFSQPTSSKPPSTPFNLNGTWQCLFACDKIFENEAYNPVRYLLFKNNLQYGNDLNHISKNYGTNPFKATKNMATADMLNQGYSFSLRQGKSPAATISFHFSTCGQYLLLQMDTLYPYTSSTTPKDGFKSLAVYKKMDTHNPLPAPLPSDANSLPKPIVAQWQKINSISVATIGLYTFEADTLYNFEPSGDCNFDYSKTMQSAFFNSNGQLVLRKEQSRWGKRDNTGIHLFDAATHQYIDDKLKQLKPIKKITTP